MNKNSEKSSVFMQWLKSARGVIFYCLACFFIFWLIMFLSDMPLQIFYYPFFLCCFIGVAFAAFCFLRFRALHKSLEEKTGAKNVELPKPKDLISEDYTKIIEEQAINNAKTIEKINAKQKEADNYFALWAHQIKVPIQALRLALQTAEFENLPKQHRRGFYRQLFAVEQYSEMALQYQRLNSPQQDFVFEYHSRKKLVNAALKGFAPLFMAKGLTLDVSNIEGGLSTDEKWFIFILEQILSNALKYTQKGGVKIYCTDEQTLCVHDSGIGIKKSDLPRIFERSFTGANGRIEEKATGLGLYLCGQTAKKLGLQLSIDSAQGKGTLVSIKNLKANIILE